MTPVVSGFTILNGSAPPNAVGGGIVIVPSGVPSSPTITNCIFRSNTAQAGGAIYMDLCRSLVTNCRFLENNANVGAGVQIVGGFPDLTNCVFFDNVAIGNGGGLSVVSGALPLIVNCTLGSNGSAFGLGGGLYTTLASLAQIRNCIFWGNLDASGSVESGQIGGTGESMPSVLYSTVQGGWADTGNTGADPMFVDADGGDLHVNAGSPAIDAADNDAVSIGVSTDLDGNPRFVDDAAVTDTGNPGVAGPPVVDMGAYEFTPSGKNLAVVFTAFGTWIYDDDTGAFTNIHGADAALLAAGAF